jgi:hypothetical protein
MKQLLPLFLFLLPCLALAQYPSNGNQKITLGEQTTADGLIFRGVLADTFIITPSSDTSAYIILDTVNHRFYNYNRATNVWSVAGGGTSVTTFSGGTTGLTPSTATSGAVTLGGTLAVANGGTGTTSFSPNNYLIRTNSDGIFDTSIVYEAVGRVGIGTASPLQRLDVIGYARASSGFVGGSGLFLWGDNASTAAGLFVATAGNVGIGTSTPQSGYRLHVVDSVYVGGRVSAAGYTTRSDYNLKDEIKNINYGLNEIMQITPVSYTYKSNGEHQLGFIAQDIGVIIPESVHFDELMGVDYQSIIPILTKAIQEQQALIKALEQRIINLENK